MTYLSNIQRNILLLALIIPFLILFYLDYLVPGVYILYLAIYLLFILMPVSKDIYYKNGTLIQRTILIFLLIFLTWGIFLSYNYLDLSFLMIILFSIIFLNYTSTTLQISTNYHPIITNSTTISIILNIIIIISSVTSSFIIISIWGFEYLIIPLSNIFLIGLVISSFSQNEKNKKSFNNSPPNE